MTNYEAIKAMDKNELAKWLALVIGCDVCHTARETCDNCQDVLLDWLDEETGDDIVVEHCETSDMIHHPDHYTWKGTECKKVIEIMTRGLSGAEAYYMGNIIKYLYRYPKKGTLFSDLAKAEEYTKFLRELFTEDGGNA